MEKVRTVSDTKRDFYTRHTRPINSIYRRVVEELIVELHLLSVNQNFRVDPFYCLGVVSSFERFMQGYRPEEDKESIFRSLCQAVGDDLDRYRSNANLALNLAQRLNSADELIAWLKSPQPIESELPLSEAVHAIVQNPQFKYNRPFGIGLYTMFGEVDLKLLQDQNTREQIIIQLAEIFSISPEKFRKDFDLYQTNLEKMQQIVIVVEEALEAERKKREKKVLEIKQNQDEKQS